MNQIKLQEQVFPTKYVRSYTSKQILCSICLGRVRLLALNYHSQIFKRLVNTSLLAIEKSGTLTFLFGQLLFTRRNAEYGTRISGFINQRMLLENCCKSNTDLTRLIHKHSLTSLLNGGTNFGNSILFKDYVTLTIYYDLYSLRISKVSSILPHGSVERVHSKEHCFIFTFLAFFCCFSSKYLSFFFFTFLINYQISTT